MSLANFAVKLETPKNCFVIAVVRASKTCRKKRKTTSHVIHIVPKAKNFDVL